MEKQGNDTKRGRRRSPKLVRRGLRGGVRRLLNTKRNRRILILVKGRRRRRRARTKKT